MITCSKCGSRVGVTGPCKTCAKNRTGVGRTYTVKCDRCHEDIRATDSLTESAAGGTCGPCHALLIRRFERIPGTVRRG